MSLKPVAMEGNLKAQNTLVSVLLLTVLHLEVSALVGTKLDSPYAAQLRGPAHFRHTVQ